MGHTVSQSARQTVTEAEGQVNTMISIPEQGGKSKQNHPVLFRPAILATGWLVDVASTIDSVPRLIKRRRRWLPAE